MLVRTADLVTAAAIAGRAVAAFNVITVEHAEAIAEGAERAGHPVILQISQNAVRYHGGRLGPIAAAMLAVAEASAVPMTVHLDHVTDDDLLHAAPDHGFSSVMYDASALPYERNVDATLAASKFAHAHGLWLEAELGRVGGKPDAVLDAHAPDARTDPAEAAAFVTATGVDALAVAVGSVHAMTSRAAALDHDLIERLHSALDVPLVLHGSSGVPDDELVHAVRGGIAKVNIGTALNVAFTGAVRACLTADPHGVDPRAYLRAAREAMATTVASLVSLLMS